MIYRVVKLTERKYLIAREGFDGILTSIAECRSEFMAKDLAGALNATPQPEAKAVAERLRRETERRPSVIHAA